MDILVRGADAIAEVVWQTGRGDAQQVRLRGGRDVGRQRAGRDVPRAAGSAVRDDRVTDDHGRVVHAIRVCCISSPRSPIVWASSVSPVMRGSGRRLVHVTVALVLAKPAITVTLVVGTKSLANAGAPGVGGASPDGAAALGTLVTGFSCFAIVGLSPWVVYRLLPSSSRQRSRQVSSEAGCVGMTAVQAGLMVKSLGVSSAASAATRV